MSERSLELRAGDTVEVRSGQEILSTLDGRGALEGLPFMPEMLRYCGGTFKVYRRADKTCVEGDGMRRMPDAVFLEDLRCDGSCHDGCQRRCLFFWKEVWLKRPGSPPAPIAAPSGNIAPPKKDGTYWCQSTALRNATSPLSWWDPRQYLRDLRTGEITMTQFLTLAPELLYKKLCTVLDLPFHASLRGKSARTPVEVLGLQTGELVQVRSGQEIAATLDARGKNRGLEFSPEMIHFCGRTYRVLERVERIILEETGTMRELENTVMLEGGTCDGSFHRACPRNSYLICREIWLRRADRP